jgi:hypothetical protein
MIVVILFVGAAIKNFCNKLAHTAEQKQQNTFLLMLNQSSN